LNSALPQNGTVGKPSITKAINGVLTQQYRFTSTGNDVPIYTFSKSVNGSSTQFEIVSTGIDTDFNVITEENPVPGNSLAFLYREDGRGSGSSNSGYFLHFRQGSLKSNAFDVSAPSANQRISIEAENINDTDVWLYGLNSNGIPQKIWTKVNSTEGNNAIYNSLNKKLKDFYVVQTRSNDEISLVFADGTFGNLPQGGFRVYYRTSANRSLSISPRELTDITISFPYLSKTGTTETMTVGLELKTPVTNATISETTSSIRTNAPQTYYTQNRMVTGEDYNIVPLTTNQEIIKVKSTNRMLVVLVDILILKMLLENILVQIYMAVMEYFIESHMKANRLLRLVLKQTLKALLKIQYCLLYKIEQLVTFTLQTMLRLLLVILMLHGSNQLRQLTVQQDY